jgi:hypothetical protein
MQPLVHTLKNGATIIHLSLHQFQFSDGTVAPPQHKEFVDQFTLSKTFRVLREIAGMKVTKTAMEMNDDQWNSLQTLSQKADLVLVSFQLLQALSDFGKPLPNVVAFNATKETSRSAPDQKIVDIDNWSAI